PPGDYDKQSRRRKMMIDVSAETLDVALFLLWHLLPPFNKMTPFIVYGNHNRSLGRRIQFVLIASLYGFLLIFILGVFGVVPGCIVIALVIYQGIRSYQRENQ
ncbi:MAG: hypothetical protein ACUVWS_04695, partial [Roseiflexus sp.]